MRYRLVLVVTATASLVLVAFLVPLAMLVRSAAEDRAVNAAVTQTQAVAPAIVAADRQSLPNVVNQANADGGYQLTVFLPDGTSFGAPAPRSQAVTQAGTGSSLTVDTDGGREVLVAVAGRGEGTVVIRTFVSDADLGRGVGRAWLVLGLLGLGLLAVSVVVADQLARAVVRPLSAVVEVAHRLAGGDLAARAQPGGPREVRAVGTGLNLLAERIDELLARERETAADLSHRLRTPLTALRIDVDSVRDPAERERLAADVDALVQTADAVIRSTRQPVPQRGAECCDAAQIVTRRVEFWWSLADEEGRPVGVDIQDGPVPVAIGADTLSACVDALLGNVFTHTAEGVGFTVQLYGQEQGGAALVVADAGPGLPPRLVPARGRSLAGSTGLGLDIVQRAAEESGGRLLLDRTLNGGAMITVELGPPAS
jgi:signal transduction histidine kinase